MAARHQGRVARRLARRCSDRGVVRGGKFLIGLYIGKQGLESTYGAAASIIVVLIWVYYSAQLVLMGANSRMCMPAATAR